MRRTKALVEVAVAMMEDPDAQLWGYRLMKRSGVRSGVMYPILDRMLDEGWVTDGWEDVDSAERRHLRRRYYQLTEKGKTELGMLIEYARSDARFRGLDLGWAR
jgi:PadR family transcriptional regulator, regulatory protein PadR